VTSKPFELGRLIAILFALGAMLFAALGQFLFSNLKAATPALFFFVAALALWLFVIASAGRFLPAPRAAKALSALPARSVSRSLVAAIAALALFTFLAMGDNEFNNDNVLLWVLSIALFFYTFWEPERSLDEWRSDFQSLISNLQSLHKKQFTIPFRALLLTAILALGAFFYFYRLDATPAEMTGDHAEKLMDVYDIRGRSASNLLCA
jgi:hypothetical protein